MCNCITLIKVHSIKYLGVIFNYGLKFKDHTLYYVNNLVRKLFFKFKILRHNLNTNTLRIIYLALAQSIFTYTVLKCGKVLKIFI